MVFGLRFNRMELAGSLGDLGTLLPLSIGMILVNGLNPVGLYCGVGLFYICSGLYFRVTSPVEPMKVVSAYALTTGVAAAQIQASALWLFFFLLLIGLSGLMAPISRYIPKPVVRGVQLSTGVLLVTQGFKFMLGTTEFQRLQHAAEPYLTHQTVGPLPVGVLIGGLLGIMTLLLLNNRRLPAAIAVVCGGLVVGLLLGAGEGLGGLRPGFHAPTLLPFGFPSADAFAVALAVLALPQLPMTIGNAVIANADLSIQYFPQNGRRVTQRALCLSMAAANLGAFLLGGMPMCHGAGGLASRYRFGARTGASNLIIGAAFVLIPLLFGEDVLALVSLLPMSALGVLLVFAGAQLALTILDLQTRKALFVPVVMLGITLASNLAAGFLVGIALAYVLRSEKLMV